MLLKVREKLIAFPRRPLLMGTLRADAAGLASKAGEMIAHGADIICLNDQAPADLGELRHQLQRFPRFDEEQIGPPLLCISSGGGEDADIWWGRGEEVAGARIIDIATPGDGAGLTADHLILRTSSAETDPRSAVRKLKAYGGLSRPLLVDVSSESPDWTQAEEIACLTAAVLRGAAILKVGEVAPAMQALKVLHAILNPASLRI